jgi:hypothetical protein
VNLGPNGKRDLLVNQVNWQTPVANDSVERAKGNYNSRGEAKLSAQVKMWPTPRASEAEKSSRTVAGAQREVGEREGGGSIHSGEGHACRDFPDTGSEGLQGFWAECGLPKSGSKEQVGGGGDDKSTRLPSPTEWEPEPGLGRVVDGCADRVDRT